MALSRLERKEKLGHGGVSQIAKEVTLDSRGKKGCAVSTVSEVLNGKKRNRKIEVAIARRIGMKVTDAFPEFYPQQQTAGAA